MELIHKFFYTKIYFFFLIAFPLLICLYSCKKNKSELKKERIYFSVDRGNTFSQSNPGLTDTTGGVFTSYPEANNQVFRWSQVYDNVECSDSIDITTTILPPLTASSISPAIKWRTKVEWGNNNSLTILMTPYLNGYEGYATISILPTCVNNNGFFKPIVEIYFENRGSNQSNLNFLTSEIAYVSIKGSYSISR
jgi:hypothetical protein